ncbi:MAG: MBL fold metallo-hydrolase [Chloroflexota bacterium]|nr:MAG: MBL fold metallo-hydrolase [Chloroflexota bacterium]
MPKQSSDIIQFSLGRANAFIVRGKSPIIVDTGYPGSAPAIIKKLKENGIEPKSVSLILITHGHADHFGSAAELKKLTGAPVAVHKLDAEALIKGEDPPLDPTGSIGRFFLSRMSKQGPAKSPPVKPDIIIENDLDLSKFGVEGRVIHTPGHTPGSISVLLSDGKVIAGDMVMRGIVRFWQPHYPLFANNIFQLKESVKLILRKKPIKIYSGHGGPFNPKAVLRRFS